METTTNYSNKPIDILAFQGVQSIGMASLAPDLFAKGGSVCTGIQKLIQEWVILMMTPKGSIRFYPQRGTDFYNDIMQSFNENDAYCSFLISNAETIDQLKEEETDNTPEDEKIKSVELNSLSIKEDCLSLSVTITSEAGTSSTLVLPISSNPIPV